MKPIVSQRIAVKLRVIFSAWLHTTRDAHVPWSTRVNDDHRTVRSLQKGETERDPSANDPYAGRTAVLQRKDSVPRKRSNGDGFFNVQKSLITELWTIDSAGLKYIFLQR